MFSLFVFVCCLVSWIFVDVITRLLFWLFLWVGLGWLFCLAVVVVMFVMYCVLVWLGLVWICWVFDFVVLVCCIVYYKCWWLELLWWFGWCGLIWRLGFGWFWFVWGFGLLS